MHKAYLCIATLLFSATIQSMDSTEDIDEATDTLTSTVSKTSLTTLAGLGSAQCFKISQSLAPQSYEHIFDITTKAVDILIKHPVLMKALSWKYEHRTLAPEEIEKAVSLLSQFRVFITQLNPALYMATGALAATSMFYAYQAVSHTYDILKEPGTFPTSEKTLILAEPFLITQQNKIILKTACYAGLSAVAAQGAYKCSELETLLEFESWDVALKFIQSIMSDMQENPQALQILKWWYNKDLIQPEALSKRLQLGQAIIPTLPRALNVAKGALAIATLYGVYKMVTCGYEYFKTQPKVKALTNQ